MSINKFALCTGMKYFVNILKASQDSHREKVKCKQVKMAKRKEKYQQDYRWNKLEDLLGGL
ncbi:hypothetical protein [Staphylococcus simulans]|uniref:hypothetical protein n=1 Tax=Staphylococcus simulans TaxID=1286 RepID=UPI00399A8F7B